MQAQLLANCTILGYPVGLTQPCTVVGIRCAFSAKNLSLALEPPLDMPRISPRAAAVGGSVNIEWGMWTEILSCRGGVEEEASCRASVMLSVSVTKTLEVVKTRQSFSNRHIIT